jgi:hypothetical protein
MPPGLPGDGNLGVAVITTGVVTITNTRWTTRQNEQPVSGPLCDDGAQIGSSAE